MRIHRIKMENWRGVESREIDLEPGVTIIEGPNEIGKTTLVEALRLLISTLDSSGAANVKAIKPVGRDVGSYIEAEFESGKYRFTYKKQFNKNKNTSLHISAPENEQLTGREAHERVEEILKQTMDLALWETLLVDQGKDISQAKIKDSAGLSKSLDEAAGAAGAGTDDTDIISSVEAGYGNYFTPGGSEKKIQTEAEERFADASTVLDDARESIARIDSDLKELEVQQKGLNRQRAQMPGLLTNVETHQEAWNRVTSLKSDIDKKQLDLNDAQQLLDLAGDAGKQRRELVEKVTAGEQLVQEARQRIAPIESEAKRLRSSVDSKQSALNSEKARYEGLKKDVVRAKADRDFFQKLDALSAHTRINSQLTELAGKKDEARKTLAKNKVDNEALAKLRDADTTLAVASGQRRSAATKLEISPQKDLELLLNDTRFKLKKSEADTHELASRMVLEFPGLVSLSIDPPASAEEINDQFVKAKRDFEALCEHYEMSSYSQAIADNEARNDAKRDLDGLIEREQTLLNGSSKDDFSNELAELQEKCDAYTQNRPETPVLPSSTAASIERLNALEIETQDAELTVSKNQSELDELRGLVSDKQVELHTAQQEHKGQSAALMERKERLTGDRDKESDEELEKRVQHQKAKVEAIKIDYESLKAELEQASPEATETKFTNAQQVLSRAKEELRATNERMAVLMDRLEQAQANGKHEALDAAERDVLESEAALKSVKRRAAAVELLFSTLKNHRDITRRTYVLPLKERIEKLGEIVFGVGFKVDIDEDWSIKSRTLNDETIPFNSLSVGAREQMGIITRLAVAQIVSDQGGVPLIIDDALGFSDPTRLESMGAAIARAGQESQILLLTCSPGRFTHVGNANLVKF